MYQINNEKAWPQKSTHQHDSLSASLNSLEFPTVSVLETHLYWMFGA